MGAGFKGDGLSIEIQRHPNIAFATASDPVFKAIFSQLKASFECSHP
jgi:hypothetical protein